MTLREPALTVVPRPFLAHPGTPVDVRSVAARAYVRSLAVLQAGLERRIRREIPSADVRWRYRTVLDGLAVVVPRSALGRLSRILGVQDVYLATGYGPMLDHSVPLIGAPTLWGPSLSTAGQGMKIGIIDDGLDFTHTFFRAAGYAYPAGYPKGDTRFTSPKVIVARTFSPATALAVHRDVPFDPENSEHGTHVAGIAAGDDGTGALLAGTAMTLSGVAPRAYLGNYKVMSVPTPSFGIDGNSPEIAAAIDAAVADGMNVLNLSLGEPEVAQARDIVVQAIENAAKARVVTTVAAGNDYGDFADGSINSPGTAPSAITVAASGTGRDFGVDEIAGFSSGGPAPISLQLKPDVTAPGVSILSSLPGRAGTWAAWSGTSMASPHVAGAAALLLQRHPSWTVAQLKSALVLTGKPVYTSTAHILEVSPLRQGGGRIDLPGADNPLVFAAPTNVSFGLVRPGAKLPPREVALTDAGGGAGAWSTSVVPTSSVQGVAISVPAQVSIPGSLRLAAAIGAGAREGDAAGFVVLRNGAGITRRIPFWLHLERPQLQNEPHTTLSKPGSFSGNTRGKQSRVTAYRYPTKLPGGPALQSFPGPEQVFRFRLRGSVANAGVVVTSTASGVAVVPHVVVAGDENRLTGYAGLPINIDPYQTLYGQDEGVAAVDLPRAGTYDAVFDTPRGGSPGRFTFRFWINDVAPPAIQLVTPRVGARGQLRLRVTDKGSGVDPRALEVQIDGKTVAWSYKAPTGRLAVDTKDVAAGNHELTVRASDYQEAKNMENTGRVLPNTRVLRAKVVVG